MGNWHCIPSNCATVHYCEYEPPKIRWQYPNEPWQEINGADDYSTQVATPNFTGGQCFDRYVIKVTGDRYYYGNFVQSYTAFNSEVGGPIKDIKVVYYGWCLLQIVSTDSNGNDYTFYQPIGSPGNSFVITSIVITKVNGQIDNCGDLPSSCTFTITKNGQTVHTETRAVCPEVQKIPCKLSGVRHSIKIKKIPYLERVEVRDQSINTVYLPPANTPLIDVSPLPTECLNVYVTYILAPPILSNFVPLPGAFNLYQLIAQICSAPDCPPPEYQVICDCNSCESCPDGTCALECDGQICCYGSDGVSVKQIATSNYCGGQS